MGPLTNQPTNKTKKENQHQFIISRKSEQGQGGGAHKGPEREEL
jgi:hypothetical protein